MAAAHIDLTDGRRLSYVETGPRTGIPVIACHGAIGTSLGRSAGLEAITADLGVRHIGVSRPGFASSDPAPGRSVISFAADIRELADALGLARFAVVGVSAGGPYALGVGHALPDRVSRVAVCSSLSPLCAPHATPGLALRNRLGLRLLAREPRLCAAVGDRLAPIIHRHPGLLALIVRAGAARDERAAISDCDEREAVFASFLEATARGARGIIDDYLTCIRPWGFSPGGVQPEVDLWHGVVDPLVPIDHALALAAALPRCRVFFGADEGHHFFRRRLSAILAKLVSVSQPGQLRPAESGSPLAQRARTARR
ncbi:MAG: alpha/beta hydrolase [Solirubrobacteraceae bacterium]|jgi:pimeloyl-ACP methyl ester carboxylesterase